MKGILILVVATVGIGLAWVGGGNTAYAGSGRWWDCDWGFIYYETRDNGAVQYNLTVYAGKSAPTTLMPLITGSATGGFSAWGFISASNQLSPMTSPSSTPPTATAAKAALSAYAANPTCPVRTADQHPTFAGFNTTELVSHGAERTIGRK